MKQLYAYFLPLAAAAWMLIFLPFSEGAIDYLLVGVGVVLAIAALILKQKEQTAREEQQKLAIIDSVAQTKLQQEELAKVQKDILEHNANKQQEILEAFATKMIDGQQMLAKNITAALDTQTTNLLSGLNDLNRPLQDIQGAVKDLEEGLDSKVKYLIEAVEAIPEGYQPLINQITTYSEQATVYTEQMGYIQSQVVTSTQKQLTELAMITESLQLSVTELASSKHVERQQAMKVQTKLMEQYAKMK